MFVFCNYIVIMKTNIVSIGNSQGIRIPKILLEQSRLSGEVELEVRGESIVIRPARKPRENWEEAFRRAATAAEDDAAETFGRDARNQFDEEKCQC